MNTHNNARLTPKGREDMVRAVVDRGLSKAAAARQFNTTTKTVAKWVARFKAEGVNGLRDRSSKPLSSPSQIPLATCAAVERLRRERRTQEHIAGELGISKASVSRILKRCGLSLLSSLEPQEPRPRYERDKPGEIIHLDIKKLGRFNSVGHRITGRRTGHCSSQAVGWECRSCHHRRPLPRRPCRHLPGSEEGKRRRLPLCDDRLLQEPRRHRRTRHDRQWQLLKIQGLRPHLQAARPQAHQDQTLHATDQRQGPTLHPNRAQGMGLRHSLRALRATPPSLAALAPSLQIGTGLMLASPRKLPSAVSA